MKRRRFIQSTLIAAAATPATAVLATSNATTRLYGTPGSLTGGTQAVERFMLPISRSGVPVEGWLEYSRFSAMIEELLDDSETSEAFNKDPSRFLRERGMDGSDLVKNDVNVALLVAMSQPEVRRAVHAKDFRTVLSYLKAAGVFDPVSTDSLTKTVSKVIERNRQSISEGMKLAPGTKLDLASYKELLATSGGSATPFDAAALAEFAPANDALILGAFAAVVSAVLAAVGVHSLVAVFTWAVVVSKVKVEGEDDNTQSRVRGAYGALLQRTDLGAQQNIEVAGRVSMLTGSPLVYDILQDEIAKAELMAFFVAMKEHGLLDYEELDLPDLIEATLLYTQKSIRQN